MRSGVRVVVATSITAVVITACSATDALPPTSTNRVATTTTFRTEPVRSTTTAVPPPPTNGGGGDASGRDTPVADDPTEERTYTIRNGDYLLRIAREFDVSMDFIVAYNGWESVNHALTPGEDIKIPPSDYDPVVVTEGGDTVPADAGEGPAADATCPDGAGPTTYTIQRGDVPGAVAAKYGVTVAELDAANVGTSGYRGFVVGITVNIPC
ncbi:hypothetical protein BH24ACT5_BH24ACT5_07120 [soil metagenome]